MAWHGEARQGMAGEPGGREVAGLVIPRSRRYGPNTDRWLRFGLAMPTRPFGARDNAANGGPLRPGATCTNPLFGLAVWNLGTKVL